MAGLNSQVKKANEKHEYTPDMIHELDKCSRDAEYFIHNYCMIQNATEGTIPFHLRDYQRKIIGTFSRNRLSIALAPRQIGKSWIAGAYLLWFAIFHSEKTVLILSNKNDNAMEMIHRVRFIYENLPHWLKPGVTADGWNKHACAFDNGSRIISQATSENSGRGLAISLLFLDEFAFVRDSIAEEFWTSVSPTLATGGSCIICSTPNGDVNRFAQLWRGANIPAVEFNEKSPEAGFNEFAPIEIKWNEPPNRDEAFKAREIAKIGTTRWLQEYECEFISSDPLLLDPVVLQNIQKRSLSYKAMGQAGDIVFYKMPTAGATYLIGGDLATGTGSDYTVFVAYEFPSLEQVAEFRSNTTSSVVSYHMLKKMIRIFEKAQASVYFTVENNGVGEGVITLFEADENPPATAEFVSESGQKRKGMTTTGKSKLTACLAFKEMLERDNITIKSQVTVKELGGFVRTRGAYAAKPGATDDSIMATIQVVRMLSEISKYDDQAYDKLFSGAYYNDGKGDSIARYDPTEDEGYGAFV